MMAVMLAAVTPLLLHSQSRFSLSVHGGGALHISRFDSFDQYPGIPVPAEAGPYRSERRGISPLFELQVDYSVNSWLATGIRLAHTTFRSNFTATEVIPIAGTNGQVIPATLEHRLDGTHGRLGVDLFSRIHLHQRLAVDGGFQLSFPLSNHYSQTQRFTDPIGISFDDGSRIQVTSQGSIPGLRAVALNLNLRMEGNLPLNARESLKLVPFVGVNSGITSTSGAVNWRYTFLVGGIGLRYTIPHSPIYADTVLITDTVYVLAAVNSEEVVRIESSTDEYVTGDTLKTLIYQTVSIALPTPPSVHAASVGLAFRSAEGLESSSAEVVFTTLHRKRYSAIIPVIITPCDSSQLPDDYSRQGAHTHYSIVPLIKEQLAARRQRLSVTLKPCLGSKFGTAARELALNLATALGVNSDVLDVSMSDSVVADNYLTLGVPGQQILILHQDTVVKAFIPPVIIRPSVVSEHGVSKWKLALSLGSRILKEYSGTGEVPIELEYFVHEGITGIRDSRTEISCALTIQDSVGTIIQGDAATLRIKPKSSSGRGSLSTIQEYFIAEELTAVTPFTWILERNSSRLDENVVPSSVQFTPVAPDELLEVLSALGPLEQRYYLGFTWLKGVTP